MNKISKYNNEGYDFCAFLDYDSSADACLYEIGSYNCIPGYSYGPVIRPRGILHYVTSGKGKLFLNSKEYDVSKDQIFYIPADINAYYVADIDDPWSYKWLHIGGANILETLKDINLDISNPVFDLSKMDNHTHNKFNKIIDELFTNFQSKFYSIAKIYELLDIFLKYGSHSENNPESQKLKYVKTVIKYIELKYSEHISIENIADTCCLNRSYLSRLFHEATGKTIKDYLLSVRMQKAEKLLKNSEYTISHIAFAVGYSDIFSFSKAFKKKRGITPSEYRSLCNGDII